MSKHVSTNKNKHISQTKPRKTGKASFGIPEWLKIYPDYSFDRDGYELSLQWFLLTLIGAGALVAARVMDHNAIVCLGFSIGAFIFTGMFIFFNLFHNLTHGRFLCESLLIVLAGILAIILQMYSAGTLIFLFYDIAKAVELYLVRKQQERAQQLLDILPRNATVLVDGEERHIKPVHICEGDILVVRAKEIIPIDGIIQAGMSSIDESPLTNEEEPVAVAEGSEIRAGCINISKPLVIAAQCDYSDSTAHKIYSAFTSVMKRESEQEVYAVKICNVLTPLMLMFAVLSAVVFPLFTGKWESGLKLGIIFLLAGCPYGIPGVINLATFTSLTNIFSNGIWLRDIHVHERLAKLEAFLCNKTGTVTESKFTVTEICPEGMEEEHFLAIAGQVESRSTHPIAVAIRRCAGIPENYVVPGLEVEEIQTKGISAVIGENTILIGNAALLYDKEIYCAAPSGQGTAIHMAVNGTYCGYMLLDNPIRQGNYEAIEQMRACGVKSFALLSGDLRSAVRPLAGSLNFNIVKGELDVPGKENAAEYLMSNKTPGKTIGYAGDGFHEMAAARHTDVAIITGALHSGIHEEADVNVMAEGITVLPEAIRAANTTARIATVTLLIFSGIRLGIVIFGMLGLCPVAFAAAVLSISEVVQYSMSSVLFEKTQLK